MRTRKTVLRVLALLLCATVLLLTACSVASKPELNRDGVLVYPGTQWNTPPEEVLSALGLSASDCTVTIDTTFSPAANGNPQKVGQYTLVVENREFLGEKAILELQFRQYAEDAPIGLDSVIVRYADDVDMAALKTKLVDLLGEPTKVISDHVESWDSEKPWTAFMGENSHQTVLSRAQARDEQFKTGTQEVDYLERTPASCIRWTDDASFMAYNAHQDNWGTEYNQIVFYAPMVQALQLYSD